MIDSTLTIVGNLTDTPELRMTQAGIPVTTFRLASTPRRYDRQRGEWVDGETLFLSVSCWRLLAENAASSLRKGDRAVVAGRLRQRAYQGEDGSRRVGYEVEADAVGPELGRYAVDVKRVVRGVGHGGVAAGGPSGGPERSEGDAADGTGETADGTGEAAAGDRAPSDPVTPTLPAGAAA